MVGEGWGRCWAVCDVLLGDRGRLHGFGPLGGMRGAGGGWVVKPFQRAVQSIEEQGNTSHQGEF